MCGIFGWISPGKPVDRERGVRATNLMRHRGPDDEGYLFSSLALGTAALAAGDETKSGHLPHWRDERVVPGADVMLGFRRLAIHDLSAAGHQPMGTPDSRVWIVFNGEVYNFPELRQELEAEGVSFCSRTDTEIILHAYVRWGADCLRRFNGMWGLAILDLRRADAPLLFLARDRCGVKPLYYSLEPGGGIAFASEQKAVLPTRDGRWSLAEKAVTSYLATGRFPGALAGDTFLTDVRMLPPGCCAEWAGGRLEVRRWWELGSDGDGTQCGEEEALGKLRGLFEDAVALRLRADVPVGSCLSGGLDSSSIVAMVSRLLQAGKGPTHTGAVQHTFSSVYRTDGPYNEKRFVDRMLQGQPTAGHFAWPEKEGLAEAFERMVWHQDEPFIGTTVFAQWCVMQAARENGVTVLLDGQAADELFGGYRPYRCWFREMMRGGRIAGAVREARAVVRETGYSPWRHLLRGTIMAALPNALVQAMTRRSERRKLRSAAGVVRADRIGQVSEALNDECSPLSKPWRHICDSLDRHLRREVLDASLPRLLQYEDRNSMAFSIEARVPFTDYRLVEFAFSPAIRDLKLRGGWAKWCLRKALSGLAPDDIVWRRDKMGFGTPEAAMVRHLIASRGERDLEASPVSDYLLADGVRRDFQEAASNAPARDSVTRAFRCMAFGSWAAQFPLR